jgi:hypothetical protein
VSFGPASPVTATPASLGANTGTSNIKFQAINANSCVGSIGPVTGATLNGVAPTNVSLCSGTAACQNPITVPATFDNESTTQSQNYTVSVTCTGTSGQAASQAIVTVPKKGGGGDLSCLSVPNSAGGAFTRVTTPGRVTDFHGDSFNVDYTTFNSSLLNPWPANLGEQIIFSVPTSGFVALSFTVPAGFAAQQLPGFQGLYELSSGSSGWSAKTTLTISTKCGDFSAPSVSGSTTLCYGNALAQSGFILYGVDGSRTCNLTDNTQYYLNFINANVANVGPNGTGTATSTANANCTGSTCVDTIQIVGKNWQ